LNTTEGGQSHATESVQETQVESVAKEPTPKARKRLFQGKRPWYKRKRNTYRRTGRRDHKGNDRYSRFRYWNHN
jgi:hypothetical protein